MNKCSFGFLKVSENVVLTVPSAICQVCGGEIGAHKVNAKYNGHVTNGDVYDLFVLHEPIICKCGNVIYKYAELCDEGGMWIIEKEEASIDVPLRIIEENVKQHS